MRNVLLSFFTAIDGHDWAGMRQCLSDSVTMGAGRVETGDGLVGLSRATGGGFDWTSHNMIRYKESPGEATFDLVAVHYLSIPSGDNWYTLLRGVLTGVDASGRINRLETTSMEQTGNPALLDIVRQRASQA